MPDYLTERQLHKLVYDYLSAVKPKAVWAPVPNGATDLGKRLGGILKTQGKVVAGVPDFIFLWGTGSGGIELKVGRNGQSEPQKDFQDWCRREGVAYAVCRNLDEVIGTLTAWGRL